MTPVNYIEVSCKQELKTSCKMTKIARDKMASLSEENIKCLYRCENKTKRRQVMGKILNCPSCDSDEDDIKTSILLDFYLESINFAAEGGFSWQQGLAVFELMKELLNDTLGIIHVNILAQLNFDKIS